MPKKVRRAKAKRRTRPARKTIGESPPQQVQTTLARPEVVAKTSRETHYSIDRYQYVLPELRRIGILAGSVILILIILSFIVG